MSHKRTLNSKSFYYKNKDRFLMLFDQIIQNQFLNVEEILSEEDLKFYSFYLI